MSDTAEYLVTQGEYRKASEILAQKPQLSLSDRVLKAWIELETGDSLEAISQVTVLLPRTSNTLLEAHCLAIQGLAAGRSGSTAQSVAVLRKALAVAAQFSQEFEAELLARYTHGVLAWIGIEPAMAELPRLRQLALKTGNRRALVEYHIIHARIAAWRGSLDAAIAETDLAESLLGDQSHHDLRWRLQHDRSGFCLMDGRVADARLHAKQCLDAAQAHGSKVKAAYSLGNLAYIAASAGDFTEARTLLDECLESAALRGGSRLAALNTGIHIGIATGQPDLAHRMVREGVDAAGHAESEHSYYRLWFENFRVRWLIQQGHYRAAVAAATGAAQAVTHLADWELRERLKLSAAEALVRSGDYDTADQIFGEVALRVGRASLEVFAEVLRVAALLSARHRPTEAIEQLSTALRLLTSAGLFGFCADIEFTATSLGLRSKLSAKFSDNLSSPLTSVGTVLRLGRHPRLLGGELVLLLARENIEAYVSEEQDMHEPAASQSTLPFGKPDEDIKFSLGTDGRSTYWLRAPKPSGIAQHLLWTAVEQIVNAALALHGRLPGAERTLDSWTAESPTIQHGMIAAADKSLDLLDTARKLAPSNITVLITGETGTGKELLARALHDSSPRSSKPFIPFNCSAVSRDMLDAQLFGHRRGAFTGATEAFDGVIRAAAGGTLFLDEIGEITLDVQPKLLRFLESGEIHPLGEPRPLHVDVRVVAATNADLDKLVSEGRFREDLFYRLNVVRLQVPPLRERREEIPPLVQHYLDKCSREAHKTGLRLADETLEYLILYKWPGNVRQLANEVRRMVALAESGAVLMPEHLSHDIAASRRTIPATDRYLAPTEFVVRVDQPMSAAMEHVERSMIQYALRLSGGRMEEAASRLGLSRKGLYLKRQRLGIGEIAAEEPSTVMQ